MIESLSGKQITCMALGSRFTIVLDSLGKLQSIGYLRPLKNSSYASESDMNLIVPVDLPANTGGALNRDIKFVKVAAGDEHCLASDGFGKLYSWGFSSDGALGTPADSIKFPTQIKDLNSCGVVDFACGRNFSIAIINPNGADLDEKIYTDFKYSRVESIKNKLTTAGRKASKALSGRSMTGFPTIASLSVNGSQKKLTTHDINKMVDVYLNHTDLTGFAGLRQESKVLWVKDLVNSFFSETMNGEQFNLKHKKLQDMCTEMGFNFEKLFYEKVMSDPIVKAESSNINVIFEMI
jgi:Regulator of chromosome condensation (RCC1) repeat